MRGQGVVVLRVLQSAIVVIAVLLGFAQTELNAQAPAKAEEKGRQLQPITPSQPTSERPPLPEVTKLNIMIQSYMVALSQANLTGIYTVLRALGAPEFQEDNPPDRLLQIFADMRTQGVDLSPIILYTPILVREPAYDEQGLLHLVGYYKTEPQQVHFDLTLQPVDGLWRLFGISVKIAPPHTVTSVTASPSTKPDRAKEPSQAAPKKSPLAKDSTAK